MSPPATGRIHRDGLDVPGAQRSPFVQELPLDDGAVRHQPPVVPDQGVQAAQRVIPVVVAEALTESAHAEGVRLVEDGGIELRGVREEKVGHRSILVGGPTHQRDGCTSVALSTGG
jgi:hypothetical protein